MFSCHVGTHCVGMLPHRQAIRPGNMLTVNQEIPDELVQASEAVLCPLLAGQMSVSFLVCCLFVHSFYLCLKYWVNTASHWCPQIHDGLLVHASDANASKKRRCGFVIRYVPTCAHPVEVNHTQTCVLVILWSSSLFLSLDVVLVVAFRILIVPGNFTQRPWPVAKIASITFQKKRHEYLVLKTYPHWCFTFYAGFSGYFIRFYNMK